MRHDTRLPPKKRTAEEEREHVAAIRAGAKGTELPQTIKWVGIGEPKAHEYVSRCGYYKARKWGSKWELWLRDDPSTEREYTDTEQTYRSFKALKQECEQRKAADDG